MTRVSMDRETIIPRVTKIVDNLFQSTTVFQERLDQADMSQLCASLMLKRWNTQEAMEITDAELTDVIKDVMVFEAMYGLLEGLTPEQMKMFDAAVEGR